MKIFNTLSGKKEDFVPLGDTVTMYVCGVTPYSDSHLGHAMSAIIFDVVRRYLRFRGYTLKTAQNVTDVDDKIINRSNQMGIPAAELAKKYADRYQEDMEALNVAPADIAPRATEEIPAMLNVIKKLVGKGFAYPANGSVYFRVKNMPDYGKLSHRKFDDMMTGASIEPGEEKEDPLDFVLWKASKPGEPSWDSPWGKGRPGWHIECSTMSTTYLGDQIDIHGGGTDLIFPHHENEIAQSECFTGKAPFVKYWMHNGALQMGSEKMSKSLGNLVTIRQALEKISADGLRVFVLSSYYRSPLTYSEDALQAAEKGAERLRQAADGDTGDAAAPAGKAFRDRFIEAMDDDFNSSQAMAVLFDMVKEINRAGDTGTDVADLRATLRELGGVLGLTFKLPESAGAGDAAPFIDLLIEMRAELRKSKQFQLADMVRDKLAALGVVMEDTPKGTTWKIK